MLFGNPERVLPQLSPDGERMAYLAPVDGVLNLWVGDAGRGGYRPITRDSNRGIRTYFWAYDSVHLLYLQDDGGDENWRLYSVDVGTDEIRGLTPFEGVQARVLSRNKDFPSHLLIGLNRDDPQTPDVYRLDLATGGLELLVKNPGNVVRWIADRKLAVRAALAARPDGGFDLLCRPAPDAGWSVLLTWSSEDSLASAPIGFTGDGGALYIRDSRGADTGRLVKIDVATRATEVLAEDADYDVSSAFVHPDTYEVQAASFTRDRNEWLVLDAAIEPDFAAIRRLHHGDFFVVSRDLADRSWLVAFNADDGPIRYYLFDRASKTAAFLFDHRPQLDKYALARAEPFQIVARDGLTLHGHITFPIGVERRGLPLVLSVHGGPWGRDTWGFQPETQWFANRGYICLQVNFRGSTGYGKQFLNAADREWGGKMHDDLIDAVDWTIEKGYADRTRIAIFGASYGGYAALAGAAFTPDRFRCAVDIVGISNIITWIQSFPPHWKPMLELVRRRVGDPEKDREFLESRSPLFHAHKIEIPMLIAQGANDPRVPRRESEQIVAALEEKGIEHEYIVFEDEGHGFAKHENRLKFYGTADRFLARHLGGRCE